MTTSSATGRRLRSWTRRICALPAAMAEAFTVLPTDGQAAVRASRGARARSEAAVANRLATAILGAGGHWQVGAITVGQLGAPRSCSGARGLGRRRHRSGWQCLA